MRPPLRLQVIADMEATLKHDCHYCILINILHEVCVKVQFQTYTILNKAYINNN